MKKGLAKIIPWFVALIIFSTTACNTTSITPPTSLPTSTPSSTMTFSTTPLPAATPTSQTPSSTATASSVPSTPVTTSTPPVSSPAIQLPDADRLLPMILKQLCKDEFYIVSPRASISVDTNLFLAFTYRGLTKESIISALSTGGYDAKDLVDLFFELNKNPVTLTITSSPEHGYSIDHQDKFNQYVRDDPVTFWKQWHLDNPEAFGYMIVSIPATDSKTGYIMISVTVMWGELACSGDIIVYRYNDGTLFKINSINLIKVHT